MQQRQAEQLQKQQQQASNAQQSVQELAGILCLVVQHTQHNALQDVATFCRAVCAHPQLCSALLAAAKGRLCWAGQVENLWPALPWLKQHAQLLRKLALRVSGTQLGRCEREAFDDVCATLIEAARPGGLCLAEFTAPWVTPAILAALPAHSLTSLTLTNQAPQDLSQPVLQQLVTLKHLRQLTIAALACPDQQQEHWGAIVRSLAALTALTRLQTPYLAPGDQQALPPTLQELWMVNGAFGSPEPLRLAHLTALTRLVCAGNSWQAMGAFKLVRGSALPPGLQQLEAQAVASTAPLLGLQQLRSLVVHKASDSSGLFCPAEELLALTQLSALTRFEPSGPLRNCSAWIDARPVVSSTVQLPVDVFVELGPVFAALSCTLRALSVSQRASPASILTRAHLPSLVGFPALTDLTLCGHHAHFVRCPLQQLNKLPAEWLGMDAVDLGRARDRRWGCVWGVTPGELAQVLQQLTNLYNLELHTVRLERDGDCNSVAVGEDMVPVVAAAAGLPRLTSLSCTGILLGPAALALQPASRLCALQLGDCFVDDGTLCGLLQGFSSRQSLTKLDLGRAMSEFGQVSCSPDFTDTSVSAISAHLPALEVLSLWNCRGVSVRALRRLVLQAERRVRIQHAGYEDYECHVHCGMLDDCGGDMDSCGSDPLSEGAELAAALAAALGAVLGPELADQLCGELAAALGVEFDDESEDEFEDGFENELVEFDAEEPSDDCPSC